MDELEKEMKARVRAEGQDTDRITGNIVYGEFIHKTSRPVDGVPDPHLHAHCFVFNATYDSEEEFWKAGQFGGLKRDAPYYEAAFHARFALKLKALGYEIEKQRKLWDLAGISKETRDKFSNRTRQIEQVAKEKGIDSAKGKDKLAALTRESKKTKLTPIEINEKWHDRLTGEEWEGLLALKNNPDLQQKVNERFTAEKAMKYALSDIFERSSVCSEKTLRATALKYGVGNVTVEEIRRQTFQAGILKTQDEEGQVLVTHQRILDEEKQMIHFTKEGMGKWKPLNPTWIIQDERVLSSPEQSKALLHICQSSDRVIAVAGQAGTGKTTMMTESVEAIKKGGHEVFVFAPSSSASRGVLRGEGFKNAQTIEYLLTNPELQSQLQDQVIWVDEAGLLGSPSMNRIFQLAQEKNCRVILSGDSGQHHSVQRGDALRILENYAELKPAKLTEIFRQKNNEKYKKVVTLVRNKEIKEAIRTLDEMKSLLEIKDDTKRVQVLSKTYLEKSANQASVLIVSPTHAESDAVTSAIRSALKEKGALAKEDQNVLRLHNLSLKTAEKLDPRYYEKGMVVKFHQNKEGIKRGELWEVSNIDRNTGEIRIKNGKKEAILPVQEPKHFQVYLRKSLALSIGDQIRITENSYSKEKGRLNNGDIRKVTGFSKEGEIILDDKYTLPQGSGNLAYGYCVTSHSSQGKTVDCVIVAESEDSLPAASLEQFYVSLSRGRHNAYVFTHNAEKLIKAVERMDQRKSAHDLYKDPSSQNEKKTKQTPPHLKNPIFSRVPSKVQKQTEIELENR